MTELVVERASPIDRKIPVPALRHVQVLVQVEVRMVFLNARVHHSPGNSGPLRREGALRRVGFHRRNRLVDTRGNLEVRPDVKDRAEFARLDASGRRFGRHAIRVRFRLCRRQTPVEFRLCRRQESVGFFLCSSHVQYDQLLDGPRLEPGKNILTVELIFLEMSFLSRVVHFRLSLCQFDVIENPLPRGLATPRMLEVQIDDDLESLGMNCGDRSLIRFVGQAEKLVFRHQAPND